MTPTSNLTERSPEDLELRIAETRASLDMKVQELERRLSPREQVRRVRARLDPEPYLGVGAAAAVVTGAVMAAVGWKRSRCADDEALDCEL
jgi:hypothetical protein